MKYLFLFVAFSFFTEARVTTTRSGESYRIDFDGPDYNATRPQNQYIAQALTLRGYHPKAETISMSVPQGWSDRTMSAIDNFLSTAMNDDSELFYQLSFVDISGDQFACECNFRRWRHSVPGQKVAVELSKCQRTGSHGASVNNDPRSSRKEHTPTHKSATSTGAQRN